MLICFYRAERTGNGGKNFEKQQEKWSKRYGPSDEPGMYLMSGINRLRGKVLDAETAEAIDADFRGKVWKLEEGELYVAKCKVKVQEDGSLSSSSPSSNAKLKDSDLIPVIYTEDTKFYVKTISGDGGESQEREGSFEDLELHMTLDMKGEFGNDGFHPSQIRMLSIS